MCGTVGYGWIVAVCSQNEAQRPWPVTLLSTGFSPSPDHPFYPLKDFRLKFHDSLEFSSSLLLSQNYFNPSWNGLRRIKNVVMVRRRNSKE